MRIQSAKDHILHQQNTIHLRAIEKKAPARISTIRDITPTDMRIEQQQLVFQCTKKVVSDLGLCTLATVDLVFLVLKEIVRGYVKKSILESRYVKIKPHSFHLMLQDVFYMYI